MSDQIRRELEPSISRLCAAKGWTIGPFLGAGATAATFEIKNNQDVHALKLYAPKFLEGKRGEQVRRRFDIVMDNLKDHKCDHLVKIHSGGFFENTLFMEMQRAPGNCLSQVLNSIPPGNIREIIRQISYAAKFLEEKELCHRDIKSDNIVISEDFTHTILLDLGVLRWLEEESDSGTDEGGQLPFIATAQYSSPEYMFRLIPPGPDLWRGLTFYQLGGVLHDLIMKTKLFDDVVQRSSENRYLIAHAVATKIPVISNPGGISLDLVLLAQRALEKDLSRRLSNVEWSDFLQTDESRQHEIILGLRSGMTMVRAPITSPTIDRVRAIEDALDKKLLETGIHCRHNSKPISHELATMDFSWEPSIITLPSNSKILFKTEIREANASLVVSAHAELEIEAHEKLKTLPKPVVTLPITTNEVFPPILIDHLRQTFIAESAAIVTYFANSNKAEPV